MLAALYCIDNRYAGCYSRPAIEDRIDVDRNE